MASSRVFFLSAPAAPAFFGNFFPTFGFLPADAISASFSSVAAGFCSASFFSVYRYVILSGCHCPFSVVDISITRSNEFIQYKWKWEHFEMHLLQVMGHSQSTLLNNTSPYQCQVSVLVSCCIKIMVCFLSHFHLWSSDSLKMPTGACQILPKLCIFGGSTTGAAIFLESPSIIYFHLKFFRFIILIHILPHSKIDFHETQQTCSWAAALR